MSGGYQEGQEDVRKRGGLTWYIASTVFISAMLISTGRKSSALSRESVLAWGGGVTKWYLLKL